MTEKTETKTFLSTLPRGERHNYHLSAYGANMFLSRLPRGERQWLFDRFRNLPTEAALLVEVEESREEDSIYLDIKSWSYLAGQEEK